jgi:hypothetical protein
MMVERLDALRITISNLFSFIIRAHFSFKFEYYSFFRILATDMQSNPHLAPLSVHRNLWWNIEVLSKQKYCINVNSVRRLSSALNEGGAISEFECVVLLQHTLEKLRD